MNPQVTAALISAVVALVVALLGIAGAIASQGVATRRAFRNSLALFERQHAAETESRRQEREAAARQEDARKFADERRVTYAKFLRLADELVAAEKDSAYYHYYALGNYAESMRWAGKEPSPADLQAKAVEYEILERKYFWQYVGLRFELDEVVAGIDLLGSGPVREAAKALAKSAAALQGRPSHTTVPDPPATPPDPEPGYDDLRIVFLAKVRHELGVETGRQHAVSCS
jgi:hypothetical protein